MRIAVLSDIHGNLPALEAVLNDVAHRNTDGIVHLGDLVGYGPNPNEVASRVKSAEITGVVGNYDLAVCHLEPQEGQTRYLKPSLSEVGRRTYLWTRERVSEETKAFLRELPAQLRVQEGETVFLFTHASPASPNEYLQPEASEQRLRELFDGSGAQILVVGHTHIAQVREVGDRVLLNPGSVGKPKDGDPRAAYLILDTERGLAAERIRVEFDVETVAAQSVEFGLPPEQAASLRVGRGV